MERLPFDFYLALAEDLDDYETHFSQLLRDYERELKGETLFFAVDFSELHDYIHFANPDAQRAEINSYILNSLNDPFTLLPGAVSELLTDLEKAVPNPLRRDFKQAITHRPAVAQFRMAVAENIQNEEQVLQLYENAENELKNALGDVFDIVLRGLGYTSIQALHELLDQGKLTPIQGVKQIGALSPEAKKLSGLVEAHLTLSRPNEPESNQIDALDFIVALLLNQQGRHPSNRYITIYSQAISMIQACRSHDNLQWDNDYLIRESKYLQFRTKLQGMFSEVGQRHRNVREWLQLCRELKRCISELIDIDERLSQKPLAPPLELIDTYRQFDEECIQPLTFKEAREEEPITRERIQSLYYTLGNERKFVGQAKEAYEVLKEHLRKIQESLDAFTFDDVDIDDVRAYKTHLRKWLKL